MSPVSESSVRPFVALTLLTTLALAACATNPGRTSQTPEQRALLEAGWIDEEPIDRATLADPERLDALAHAGVRGRVLRLDRLLDLYDGARFAGDAAARDSLWQALGGYATSQGIDASREVVLRLLDEAYALEDLAAAEPGALSEAEQTFVAEAIMLLATDMFLPDSAETLITQTLAYRVLAETGHPRIADNAHWRLYDHVRGVLEGAVELGPELRADIVIHALYAERDDISAWLADVGPHARPPLPSPTELWGLLVDHRDAIAEHPRWRPVIEARATQERELEQTVMALIPRPRDPGWELSTLPRGTGAPESLAPVVRLGPGELALEPTSAAPRSFAPKSEDPSDLVAGLEGLLARDGRGILLLASAPQVPAPEYAATLAALAAARTQLIELAVHEPGLEREGAEAGSPVVVALPLYVARADDPSAGAQALRGSRVHVQLSGRGPRVRVDGRWLSATATLPSDLLRLASELRRAYPRERSVSLALGPQVQHQQLVDLLAALSGGIDPAFLGVGWLPDAAIEAEPSVDPEHDAAFEARTRLTRDALRYTHSRPADLGDDDWARLSRASEPILDCVPELEHELPAKGVSLELRFDDGKLVEAEAERRGGRAPNKERLAAYAACARERLVGFRFQDHREPLTTSLIVEQR